MKIRTISVYQDDDFLMQKELAERLNKSVRTIQNWRHQGLLPFKRMGNSIFFHWGSIKKAMMSDEIDKHE